MPLPLRLEDTSIGNRSLHREGTMRARTATHDSNRKVRAGINVRMECILGARVIKHLPQGRVTNNPQRLIATSPRWRDTSHSHKYSRETVISNRLPRGTATSSDQSKHTKRIVREHQRHQEEDTSRPNHNRSRRQTTSRRSQCISRIPPVDIRIQVGMWLSCLR